jgi:hypothetical protein
MMFASSGRRGKGGTYVQWSRRAKGRNRCSMCELMAAGEVGASPASHSNISSRRVATSYINDLDTGTWEFWEKDGARGSNRKRYVEHVINMDYSLENNNYEG